MASKWLSQATQKVLSDLIKHYALSVTATVIIKLAVTAWHQHLCL